MTRLVGYAYSKELIESADLLPSNKLRASRVHGLVGAFGLDSKCTIIPPVEITSRDLTKYHHRDYVTFLQTAEERDELLSASSGSELEEESAEEAESVRPTKRTKYGLEYDCPVFSGLWTYVQQVAGASVACADFLIDNHPSDVDEESSVPVAINWTGGRHHARKMSSSGFCYVNDVVLAIIRLRTKYDKVMYIDLDLHHGDGVEAAFASSKKVLTVSVHRYDRGFFPGTGSANDRGKGMGEGYAINIPTERGLGDSSLVSLFDSRIEELKQWFDPDAVVVTCGCDGLTRDKHKEWNLTFKGFDKVVKSILDWHLPTILLGGGGYHHLDTARCWTYLTATALGDDNRYQWQEIPDHNYLSEYSKDMFEFWVDEHYGKMKDENVQSTTDGQGERDQGEKQANGDKV